jgi:NADH-quinone oxidoreductase subunit G
MRARPLSDEETQFLAGHVAGQPLSVTYADLERAPAVVLAGFEPQDESPIVFLRLRKAARRGSLKVYSVAAVAGRGLRLLSGTLLPTVPGYEADALHRLAEPAGLNEAATAAAQALRQPGAVILAGERLAEVPGALSAAARLAEATGARLAWIPRRAGERGAIEAGALPVLLPGGRPVADQAVRAEVARAWGVAALPATPGRDTAQMLAAAAAGELGALVIAGVDLADLPDPQAAREALEATPFVVSLEMRVSAVTDRADVVLPIAAVAEKAGTFVNWEGRPGSFGVALPVPEARSDLQVLGAIADQMDVHLGLPDAAAARRELDGLGSYEAAARGATTPAVGSGAGPAQPRLGQAILATWHNLLDAGRMQDGEPDLAATGRPAVAWMSAATAAEVGAVEGGKVTVATEHGAITVPAEIADMPDRVVWLPTNSAGCAVRAQLAVGHGSLVTVRSAR